MTIGYDVIKRLHNVINGFDHASIIYKSHTEIDCSPREAALNIQDIRSSNPINVQFFIHYFLILKRSMTDTMP